MKIDAFLILIARQYFDTMILIRFYPPIGIFTLTYPYLYMKWLVLVYLLAPPKFSKLGPGQSDSCGY
jgi:hypothetical protein